MQEKQTLSGGKPPRTRPPKLILASEIEERDLSWLWYPYLIGHGANLIFGRGGIGKSHITADIAAALSTGTPLPTQTGRQPKRKVLMLSAEDEYDTVLVPRLRRAGADLSRIALPPKLFTLDAKGIQMVEDYIDEFQADVVVIDPIVHFMGGKIDMFKSNEVREVMGGLHQLGLKNETSIIIVGHQRKAKKDNEGNEVVDQDSSMGSADFVNTVRSVLLVTKANDGTLVMRHVKHNYSPPGLSLPFEFDHESFQWLEPFEEDEVRASDLGRKPKAKAGAASFLRTLLKSGPVPAKEVELAAKDEGINQRTLARAKPGLAESFVKRVDGKLIWYWQLVESGKEPRNEVHGVETTQRASPEGLRGPGAGEPLVSQRASGLREPKEGTGTPGLVRGLGAGGPQGAAAEPGAAQAIAHDWLRERGLL